MTSLSLNYDSPRIPREFFQMAHLSKEEITRLSRPSVLKPTIDLLLTLLLLLAMPFLYRDSNGIVTIIVSIVCIVVSLHSFNCLASIVHASDHAYLYKNTRLNNAVGNLCAALLGYTRAGHKLAHNAHHTHLNTIQDVDRVWGDPGDSINHIARKLLEDLFGISAARRILQYSQTDRANFSVAPWRLINVAFFVRAARMQVLVIPVQLLLFAYIWTVAGLAYYFAIHIFSLIALYPAIIRLRTTVEHGFPSGYHPNSDQPRWITRYIDANWLEKFVIAPLDGHFHFEHHLVPGVPYYRLKELHELLKTRGYPIPTAPGYTAFLMAKWRNERG